MDISKEAHNILHKYLGKSDLPTIVKEVQKLPQHEQIFVLCKLLKSLNLADLEFKLLIKTDGVNLYELNLSDNQIENIASRLPKFKEETFI